MTNCARGTNPTLLELSSVIQNIANASFRNSVMKLKPSIVPEVAVNTFRHSGELSVGGDMGGEGENWNGIWHTRSHRVSKLR